MNPLLVVAAVIVEQGKVLITKRPAEGRHAGYWEFPGGKLDPGETPEMALSRELQEELGVTVEVGRIYEVACYRYDWGPVIILAYACHIIAGQVQNLEVAEHCWVAPADLHTYPILPADAPIIARLQS